MFLIYCGFWVYHLWLHPYAKSQWFARIGCVYVDNLVNKRTKSSRELLWIRRPISKAQRVIVAWKPGTEPSVVHDKQLNPNVCGLTCKIDECCIIDIEGQPFPRVSNSC